MTTDYEKIKQTAVTVIHDVCALQKGERVLIITNPEDETLEISRRLYEAADELGGKAVIVMQKTKTLLDFAEPEVIAALHTEPDICLSVSANKLGKDEAGSKKPFVAENGEEFNHIFNYNFEGKKNMRAIWTPGITIDMFIRAANIDYALLQKRCRILADKFRNASYVHVTAPGGTDIKVPVRGRTAFCDDGDFSKPGNGGNIPAGENVGRLRGAYRVRRLDKRYRRLFYYYRSDYRRCKRLCVFDNEQGRPPR